VSHGNNADDVINASTGWHKKVRTLSVLVSK